jgi:pimeloyl-ACP methyl ester carboxylesterase
MNAQSTPDTDRFIDVFGRRLRVRVHGEGPPVLLINGLGANLTTWTPLVQQLERFQVISFDAPGVGRSASPRAPYTIGRIADVALQVLDELGLQQADVLGYSLGGAVAQRLAFQHPARVRRLILSSTSPGTSGVPGSLRALLAVSTPARHYAKSGYRVTMKMIDLAPAEKESEFLQQHAVWQQEAVPSMRGYMLQMAAFSTFNSLPWLPRIEHPTLVLTGSNDHLVPMVNSAILAAHLPQARLRIFERWGHYMLHDPASGAGATVAEFFGADDARSSAAWKEALTVTPEDLARFLRGAPWSAHPGYVTGGWFRRRHPLRVGKE